MLLLLLCHQILLRNTLYQASYRNSYLYSSLFKAKQLFVYTSTKNKPSSNFPDQQICPSLCKVQWLPNYLVQVQHECWVIFIHLLNPDSPRICLLTTLYSYFKSTHFPNLATTKTTNFRIKTKTKTKENKKVTVCIHKTII